MQIKFGITALMCGLLAACLAPEQFVASAVVHADGTYDYVYSGTVAYVPAVEKLKQTGTLSPKDNADLRAEAAKATRPGEQFSYAGNGRFSANIKRTLKIGQPDSSAMPIFSSSRAPDGVITLSSISLNPKDADGLAQLGIKINGTLEVTLPIGAQVVAQNANSTPGLFNKAYVWKIASFTERPVIRFKLIK